MGKTTGAPEAMPHDRSHSDPEVVIEVLGVGGA